MTYEFDFPGGSAIITTTTGGTIDAPDFCVSGPDDSGFDGDVRVVFAAQLLRVAGKPERPAGSPLDDPVLGDDGYPSDVELARIEHWPHEDLKGLFEYIEERWVYPDCWRTIRRKSTLTVDCSTGGWSGNESLISSLQANLMAWTLTWQKSRRGGHYVFNFEVSKNVHD